MMRKLKYAKQARLNLKEIAAFITEESKDVEIAIRFTETLTRYCRKLAALPVKIGRLRPEFGDNISSSIFGSYVVYLRYMENEIEILAILHGSRDVVTIEETHTKEAPQ